MKSRLKYSFLFGFIFFIILSSILNALSIDGTSSVTLWTVPPVFPQAETDNELIGFAALANGFILENGASLTLNSYTPFLGNADFNGGSVYLLKDLDVERPMTISSLGNVYGNDYSVQFSPSIRDFYFPDSTANPIFKFIDNDNLGDAINSIDWAYADSYLAMGTVKQGGSGRELFIYYFDGDSLTRTVSVELSRDVYSVRWHPNDYYLAYGASSGSGSGEFGLYSFNPTTGVFSSVQSLDCDPVVALAWHPSGDYIVTASTDVANAQLHFNSFLPGSGILGVSDFGISGVREVQNDSISTETIGKYFAVGFDQNTNGSELALFYFDGSSISSTLGSDYSGGGSYIGANVLATDWSPTGSYIAVGLDGGSDTLRIFKHGVSNGTLVEVARVSESLNINSVSWSSDGESLFVGLNHDGGTEIRRYSFDKVLEQLTFARGIDKVDSTLAVKISSDSSYLATGDSGGDLFVYFVSAGAFLFDSIDLNFKNSIVIGGPVEFQGDSAIDCGGNRITFSEHGGFYLGENSHLTIRNSILDVTSPGIFTLASDSSRVTFKDSFIRLNTNFNFPDGSFDIDGFVDLIGSNTFFLTSEHSSTINASSSLRINEGASLALGRPIVGAEQPLIFADNTSELIVNSGDLNITSTGANFKKGKLLIDGGGAIRVNNNLNDYGLILGDGVSTNNDCELHVESGSLLDLKAGSLIYNNIGQDKFLFDAYSGAVYLRNGSRFYFQNSVTLTEGKFILDDSSSFSLDSSAQVGLYGTYLSRLDKEMQAFFVGTVNSDLDDITLNDGGFFVLTKGEIPASQNLTINGGASILGSGEYKGTLNLYDHNSSVTWGLGSFIVNDLNLAGGTLILNSPLSFASDSQLTGSGIVDLEFYSLNLGVADHTLTGSIYINSSRHGVVGVNANSSLSSTWTFSGDCRLDCKGFEFSLGDFGNIVVERGSSLNIVNGVIHGLSGNNIRCLDNSSKLSFESSRIDLSDNYTFTVGQLEFIGDTYLLGDHEFGYSSLETLSIHPDASLYLNSKLTFSIGKQDSLQANDPLSFCSANSKLHIQDATLNITSFGATFKKGRLECGSEAKINIESLDPNYGLRFGDGLDENNDFQLMPFGSIFRVMGGVLVYNNINDFGEFCLCGKGNTLKLEPGANLLISKHLTLEGGSVICASNDSIIFENDSILTSSNITYLIDETNTQYELSGTQTVFNFLNLSNGGDLDIQKGILSSNAWVGNGEGTIQGVGRLDGNVSLRSESERLNMNLKSNMNGNIILNDGDLYLYNDLKFADDKLVTGSGDIYVNGNRLEFGGTNLAWAGDFTFVDAGDIVYNSSVDLSTTLTFDGNSTLQGRGNVISFQNGGGIFVRSGTLNMTDIVLKNLGSSFTPTQLLIADGASIRMSNVYVELDNNYNTTSGDILIVGPTTFGLKNYNWAFDQASSLSVDGVTLWVDSLAEADGGLILFGSPESQYFSSLSSGTIKTAVNADTLAEEYSTILQLTSTWMELDSRLTATYDYMVETPATYPNLDSRLTATYNYFDTAITNTWTDLDGRLIAVNGDISDLDSRLTSTYEYLLDELQTTSEYLDTAITNTWIELDSRLTATYNYLDTSLTNTWIELDSRLIAVNGDISDLDSRLTATYEYLLDELQTTSEYLDTAITNTWIELDSRLTATYNYISNIYHYIPGDYYFDGGDVIDGVYRVQGTAYLAPGNNVDVGIFGGEINNLDMNDGTMTLSRDLIITSSILLDYGISGTITNDGIGPKIIFMYKSQSWEGHLTFTGDTVLDCNDQEIDFGYSGRLFVGAPGKDIILVLRNLKLKNLPENWLSLVGNSDVVFDYNVRVE